MAAAGVGLIGFLGVGVPLPMIPALGVASVFALL